MINATYSKPVRKSTRGVESTSPLPTGIGVRELYKITHGGFRGFTPPPLLVVRPQKKHFFYVCLPLIKVVKKKFSSNFLKLNSQVSEKVIVDWL